MKETRVFCDGCGRHGATHRYVQDAYKELGRQGWLLLAVGDYCPECRGQHEKQAATSGTASDVLEIVQEHLRSNGYDGLYYPGECACLADDLAPCGELHSHCEPGYRVDFKDGDCGGDCADGGCDWHIQDEKPKARPVAS